ncbi:MAG TPA: hypothetical protein VGK99_17465 [Acidobacteriota bacterium]|jgi:hypothetical protein
MLNENDLIVQLKVRVLGKATPAKDAVVFGDMYLVDGAYAIKCVEFGCENVLLIDTLETAKWAESRRAYPQINFYKGDFSNALFMKSFTQTYEMGVCFDVLLHQAPLIHTLHLMLEKVERSFCIVQPVLREQRFKNTLIYLPGSPHDAELYPLSARDGERQVFDLYEVNHSRWIWAMTPSFIDSALKGEGFEIDYQETLCPLPNDNWLWWGCVARRVAERPKAHHWSNYRTNKELYVGDWA